jgi:hypothetical protein
MAATWTDRDGRRRYLRGPTHAEVLRRRDSTQAAAANRAEASRRTPSRFSPLTTTVSDIAAWWLDQQRHRVRASSLGKYAEGEPRDHRIPPGASDRSDHGGGQLDQLAQ